MMRWLGPAFPCLSCCQAPCCFSRRRLNLSVLYLITPVLRVLTAYAERRIIKYFLLLWLLGTAIVPLLVLVSGFAVEPKLFAVTGWIGYFLLGYYLLETRVRSSRLYVLWLTGFLWTILGTYVVTALVGG